MCAPPVTDAFLHVQHMETLRLVSKGIAIGGDSMVTFIAQQVAPVKVQRPAVLTRAQPTFCCLLESAHLIA